MKALYWAFPAPFLIVHGHLEARSTWKYDDHFNAKNYMTHGRHFEDINKQEKISFRATNPVDFQKSPWSDFIWCGTILGIRISYGARGGTSRGRPLRGQKRLAPLAKSSICIKSTNPVVVNYMEKKLDITKPPYSEQMFLPVLWPLFYWSFTVWVNVVVEIYGFARILIFSFQICCKCVKTEE